MDKELKKNGVESELVIVKGAGHGQGFGQPEFEKVKEFFAKYLKPRAKARDSALTGDANRRMAVN
jgi:dipeptidyl aminopeptidase/acylaminoacyl peptidase